MNESTWLLYIQLIHYIQVGIAYIPPSYTDHTSTMASAFNLLTAGGARFDKSRFKKDIDLFQGVRPFWHGDGHEQSSTDH
jgi:hypothetical protein